MCSLQYWSKLILHNKWQSALAWRWVKLNVFNLCATVVNININYIAYSIYSMIQIKWITMPLNFMHKCFFKLLVKVAFDEVDTWCTCFLWCDFSHLNANLGRKVKQKLKIQFFVYSLNNEKVFLKFNIFLNSSIYIATLLLKCIQ